MNINASMVDQRLEGILEKHDALLPVTTDRDKKKSAAFVILCMATLLDIPLEEAAEYFTDGGNDAGVDGLYMQDIEDDEFCVTIFQGKYQKKLEGNSNFQENAVEKAVNTVATLFDPSKNVALNEAIRPKVEEIRSLVRDGYIPVVRVVLCNNGLKWNDQAQVKIDQANFPPDQVSWKHFNHDSIIEIIKKTKKVNASLRLTGKAIEEKFNFKSVLLGKVQVEEIASLLDAHGDLLLERNIRRFLGVSGNRVNTAIHATLHDTTKRDDFYFLNNGITIICKKYAYNALQGDNFTVKMEDIQIINGGQTSKTIQRALRPDSSRQGTLIEDSSFLGDFSNCFVMVRIYEIADDDIGFVNDITYATNSQNPVDLSDLHSNDEWQKALEIGMKELGYTYKRHREDASYGPMVITSNVVAEAVLATLRHAPHQAKFMRKEHFGKLYHIIFNTLNAAEAIITVLIFRKVENIRKRPLHGNIPDFLPYASHYISMLIYDSLFFGALENKLDVTMQSFSECYKKLESEFEDAYNLSTVLIQLGIDALYGEKNSLSLQQLSATFRRGDLIAFINKTLEKFPWKKAREEAAKRNKRIS